MRFSSIKVAGAFVLDLERHVDQRGFFARTWCQRELAERGLVDRIAQVSVSHSRELGTLRGLHYQQAPHAEVKVVSCNQGAIYDVVVDLRPDSPTYLKWDAAELTSDNGRLMYVPAGCAHGFQTLSVGAQVLYLISEFYAPAAARGVRYDDPALAISWPLPVSAISTADRSWPAIVPLTANSDEARKRV